MKNWLKTFIIEHTLPFRQIHFLHPEGKSMPNSICYQRGHYCQVCAENAQKFTIRNNDGEDYEHGPRASKFIDTIRVSQLSALNDEQIDKLKRACELHTIEDRTGDITIDICFDSDRMDLLRVGITPLPDRMATKKGADLVSIPNYKEFYTDFVKKVKDEIAND